MIAHDPRLSRFSMTRTIPVFRSFFVSFLRSGSLFVSFLRSFVLCLLLRSGSLFHSFVRSFFVCFVCSFVVLCLFRSFIRRSFVRSLFRSFVGCAHPPYSNKALLEVIIIIIIIMIIIKFTIEKNMK